MSLIYSALALAEVCVLVASAVGIVFLIVRSIVRGATRRETDETKRVPKEDLRHLKRAGQFGPY